MRCWPLIPVSKESGFPNSTQRSELSRIRDKTDQGCQFTSHEYKQLLQDNGIRQSMDDKSRWADNIMIERWFRSLKWEEVYLTEYANIKEARAAIGKYIYKYNFERCHSAIGNVTPASVYYPTMLYDDALESVGYYAA